MKLVKFLNESEVPKRKIMSMAILSGVANSILLIVINVAAQQVADENIEMRYFLIYLVALSLFVHTQKYALTQATMAIEDLICTIRLRIADKIRQGELRFIEKIGFANMYAPLTKDTNLISQMSIILVLAGQSVIVFICSTLYLAWLSPLSLFITVSFIGGSMFMYFVHHKQISRELQAATQKETDFFTSFGHILEGFKELKINRKKNNAVFSHLDKIGQDTKKLKISSGLRMVITMMFGQVTFYVLLIILIFVMPIFSPAHGEIIFKITATILFIIGPVSQFTSSMPMLAKTDVSINSLYHLEKQLDQITEQHDESVISTPIEEFQEITLKDLSFVYHDQSGNEMFGINSINHTIKQGEMIFVVGGNGSGKSTFLKLLTGLYYAETGSIFVDDVPINSSNYQSYRELFAIIFTDFHLFDRLYGLEDVDVSNLNSWLRLMELDEKVKYIDGQFTTTELSTGQKKRLAFIIAVLEDKPIYIFDELAADQDPQFKKKFYNEILPDLQKQGKTIIAVTHDDNYFHVGDRLLKMEDGKLINYNEKSA